MSAWTTTTLVFHAKTWINSSNGRGSDESYRQIKRARRAGSADGAGVISVLNGMKLTRWRRPLKRDCLWPNLTEFFLHWGWRMKLSCSALYYPPSAEKTRSAPLAPDIEAVRAASDAGRNAGFERSVKSPCNPRDQRHVDTWRLIRLISFMGVF